MFASRSVPLLLVGHIMSEAFANKLFVRPTLIEERVLQLVALRHNFHLSICTRGRVLPRCSYSNYKRVFARRRAESFLPNYRRT